MIAVFLRIAVRQILSKMDKRPSATPSSHLRFTESHVCTERLCESATIELFLDLSSTPSLGQDDMTLSRSQKCENKRDYGQWVIYGHLSLDYNPRSWKEGGSSISSRLQPWFKEFSVLLFSPATMPATFLGTSLATSIEAEPKRVNTHRWVSLPRVYTVHAGIVCFHSTCIHLGIHG